MYHKLFAITITITKVMIIWSTKAVHIHDDLKLECDDFMCNIHVVYSLMS